MMGWAGLSIIAAQDRPGLQFNVLNPYKIFHMCYTCEVIRVKRENNRCTISHDFGERYTLMCGRFKG